MMFSALLVVEVTDHNDSPLCISQRGVKFWRFTQPIGFRSTIMKTGSSVLLSIGLSLLLVSGGPTLVSQSAPASRAQLGQAYQERVFDTDNENRRRWSNNSLISFRQHGKSQTEAVSLYNEDGRITREAIVSLPEAEFISLSDATLDNSGSLFVSGGSSDVKGRVAHFIAQLNESGRVSRVVRTTP